MFFKNEKHETKELQNTCISKTIGNENPKKKKKKR